MLAYHVLFILLLLVGMGLLVFGTVLVLIGLLGRHVPDRDSKKQANVDTVAGAVAVVLGILSVVALYPHVIP